jgi:hypothetical protein
MSKSPSGHTEPRTAANDPQRVMDPMRVRAHRIPRRYEQEGDTQHPKMQLLDVVDGRCVVTSQRRQILPFHLRCPEEQPVDPHIASGLYARVSWQQYRVCAHAALATCEVIFPVGGQKDGPDPRQGRLGPPC